MNTVGGRVLAGLVVLVVLTSSAAWAGRFSDVLGMELETDLQGVRILKLGIDGEAKACGLKVGDRIERLDGRKVTEGWDFMARLDGLGPVLPLTVRRGEETVEVTLERRRWPGKLVFCSDRSGPWELWRMNADGSGLRQLTHHGLQPQGAAWSPDGKRVAFEWMTPYWDIWVMDEDGRNLQRLTSFPDAETRARWSPDGKFVYFISYQWGGTAIGRVNLATGEQQKIVQMAGKPGWAPWRYATYALSPDGTTLAFPRETSEGWKLYFANPDGSNVRLVPQPGAQQVGLDWSPDGKRLLWADGSAYHVWDLEREKVSGLALQPEGWPAFAPDSRSVVYERAPAENEKTDLYVADIYNPVRYRLTYHPANDRWADWWAPRQ